MFSFDSDSRETRTTLMKSFRLERGGSFESGFQILILACVEINKDFYSQLNQPRVGLKKILLWC